MFNNLFQEVGRLKVKFNGAEKGCQKIILLIKRGLKRINSKFVQCKFSTKTTRSIR